MEKDNVFTYEPKMKANLELIMDIMRCDCQEIVYMDEKIKVLEKALELACRDAYEFIVLGEGCWFGACNEKNCNKFYELTNRNTDDDIATKLNCEYFKTKAKEMMKSE